MYTLAVEKVTKDMKDLNNLLMLTEVEDIESEAIKRSLKKICDEYKIVNPFIQDDFDEEKRMKMSQNFPFYQIIESKCNDPQAYYSYKSKGRDMLETSMKQNREYKAQ